MVSSYHFTLHNSVYKSKGKLKSLIQTNSYGCLIPSYGWTRDLQIIKNSIFAILII